MLLPRTYRPSCYMSIQVRLEDYTSDTDEFVGKAELPPEEKLKTNRKKQSENIALLGRQSADLARGRWDSTACAEASVEQHRLQDEERRLVRRVELANGQTATLPDEYSVKFYTVPIETSVEENGVTTADTCHATFPFCDVPLISEVIRSALVEVWMGTIAEEDFADPARWQLTQKRAYLMFRGYVDTWDTDHTGEDATVQIQARSMEAIMIDAKINPLAKAYKIPSAGEKITVYINRILKLFPATSGLTGGDALRAVWFGANPASEPILDRKLLNRTLQTAASRNVSAGGTPSIAVVHEDTAIPGDTDPAQSLGASSAGDPRMPGKAPGHEMSLWDLITQACQIAGCLPTYDPSLNLTQEVQKLSGGSQDVLLLRPPQTMYEDTLLKYKIRGAKAGDFKRSFISGGRSYDSDIRFLVWGHNIKEMKTSRKLGRLKTQSIEVTSLCTDGNPGGRRLSSIFPPHSNIVTRRDAHGHSPEKEMKTIQVSGIRSQKELDQVAVGLYHDICRQELSVKIETDDLSSYIDPATGDVHNENPDMLGLRAGMPCRVTVAREVVDGTNKLIAVTPLSEIFETRKEALEKLLTSQGARFQKIYNQSGAKDRTVVTTAVTRILNALKSSRMTDVFYCRSIIHKLGVEGWSASLELINYIQARALPSDTMTMQINDARKLTNDNPSSADISKALNIDARERANEALHGRSK